MGIRSLNAQILAELRVTTGNHKLRQKDIMEWSTGEIAPHEGETIVKLPNGIYVAYKAAPQ